MKHSNGFEVAENAKPKEPYFEKNWALFFFKWSRMGNGREIVAHAIYIKIKNMVLILSIIGAARNLAGRNYAVTNIIS